MGGVQPSKLAESSTVTGLSYLEDGQFAKIYKVRLDSSTVNGFSGLVPKRDIEIIYPVTCLSLSRKEKFYKPQLSTYFYLYGVLNVIFQCKTFLKQL